MSEASASPAGFWRRYAAWSLDWLLLGALLAPLLLPLLSRAWRQLQALDRILQDWVYAQVAEVGGMPSPFSMSTQILQDPKLAASVQAGSDALAGTLTLLALVLFGLSALYFTGFEGGAWQATPGKRALGLRVRTIDGGGVGYGRALARHLAGAISWLLFNLGHALVAFRRDHRALHDLMAGTQVVADAPMPAWARSWLIAQAALFVAMFAGMMLWFVVQFSRIAAM